jgi:hypothetical protein
VQALPTAISAVQGVTPATSVRDCRRVDIERPGRKGKEWSHNNGLGKKAWGRSESTEYTTVAPQSLESAVRPPELCVLP